MSIDYYQGVPAPAISVENREELKEAIDLLHTQVIDNMNGDEACLSILEACMQSLDLLEDE